MISVFRLLARGKELLGLCIVIGTEFQRVIACELIGINRNSLLMPNDLLLLTTIIFWELV